MTTPSEQTAVRSYGCTFGCGNPYDFVFISVADGTTEFLCLPCFVRLAGDMVEAATNPDNPVVQAALAAAAGEVVDQAPGPAGRRGRHNAPATSDSPDLFETYNAAITPEELPEAFR